MNKQKSPTDASQVTCNKDQVWRIVYLFLQTSYTKILTSLNSVSIVKRGHLLLSILDLYINIQKKINKGKKKKCISGENMKSN
jgi:hypothetical protein